MTAPLAPRCGALVPGQHGTGQIGINAAINLDYQLDHGAGRLEIIP